MAEEYTMRNPKLFLTGATGIMGSWVLSEALDRGYEPVLLMRDPTPEQAQQRMKSVLSLAAREHNLDELRIVRGDVGTPRLGLTNAEWDELRGSVGTIIHCAASTTFSRKKDDLVLQTNVDGTRHMLEFADGVDAPFYHVSTAYVVGTREGVAREDELAMGQDFKNTYERSKFLAESMVRAALDAGQLRGAIFRPAIIVGAASNGRIAQFLNFYDFLRLIHGLVAMGGDIGTDVLRFQTGRDTTKNIVPVDWVAEAMWTAITNDGPSGKTYHLTHPKPVTHGMLVDFANDYLAQNGCRTRIECIEQRDGERTEAEQMVADALYFFKDYLQHEAYYDRTNLDAALQGAVPFPETDQEFLMNIFKYALSQEWLNVFEAQLSNA
jgi:thioester reductase-like protein